MSSCRASLVVHSSVVIDGVQKSTPPCTCAPPAGMLQERAAVRVACLSNRLYTLIQSHGIICSFLQLQRLWLCDHVPIMVLRINSLEISIPDFPAAGSLNLCRRIYLLHTLRNEADFLSKQKKNVCPLNQAKNIFLLKDMFKNTKYKISVTKAVRHKQFEFSFFYPVTMQKAIFQLFNCVINYFFVRHSKLYFREGCDASQYRKLFNVQEDADFLKI